MKNQIKITLLLASMLTVLSGALVAPALPAINRTFQEVPNSELLTKLIITLPALFIAIFSPVAGILIDRFKKLPYFRFSLLLYALSGSTGFILHNIYHILISRAFLGIAVAGIMTTATTLAGDYFQDQERNRFLGIQGAFMAFGGTIFILIAGLLADINWNYPFLVYSLSLIVLMLTYFYLHEPNIEHHEASKKNNRSVKSKLTVIGIYFLVFVGMLLFYFVPVQSPFLINKIGIESGLLISVALVASTLFAAISSFAYSRIKRKLSFRSIFLITFAGVTTGYLVISMADNYFNILLGLIIAGAGLGLLMPNANTWIIQISPPAIRGKLIGGLTATVFMGQFLSPIAASPLIENFQLSGLFFYGALIAAVFFIFLLFRQIIKIKTPST